MKGPTIRKRIIDTISERVRGIIDGGIVRSVYGMDGSTPSLFIIKVNIDNSEYEIGFPRKFNVTISGEKFIVNEVTLHREYVNGLPFEEVKDLESDIDVPVTITLETGATLTIVVNSEDDKYGITPKEGDSWNVYIGNYSSTINAVYDYQTAPDDNMIFPCAMVYPDEERGSNNKAVNLSSNELYIVVDIKVDTTDRKSSHLEDLIGDVKDEICRNHSLYDNECCLCHNVEYVGTANYTSDSNPSYIGAGVQFYVQYRNKYNDSRRQA